MFVSLQFCSQPQKFSKKQLACAGFPEATHTYPHRPTDTHRHTHTQHTHKLMHNKTGKKRNNNQQTICPRELLIQTRWATIAVNNSNLLCYSSPITEHCLKHQFETVNQPRSENVCPRRLMHTQISHQTNSSAIHLACCDTHNFPFFFFGRKWPSTVSPPLKTLGNFLNLGPILNICIKMFTFEAPLTGHGSNMQLLYSIVAANYRGVRQTGSRTERGASNTKAEVLVRHMGRSSSMESSKFI